MQLETMHSCISRLILGLHALDEEPEDNNDVLEEDSHPAKFYLIRELVALIKEPTHLPNAKSGRNITSRSAQ